MFTSLITRIAQHCGAFENENNQVLYITTPRLIVDENFLIHAHTLKQKDGIIYYKASTREIPLPNPDLYLYKPSLLTFY
jgi:hypothetical protein